MAEKLASSLADRFITLEHDLAVALERFNATVKAKQRFLVSIGVCLGSGKPATIEQRRELLDLLKTEQQQYHTVHELQTQIVELLRESSARKHNGHTDKTI